MEPSTERRAAHRMPVQIFLNKYVDGVPHLCEAVELSMSGVLVRNVLGPDTDRACYALEISCERSERRGDAEGRAENLDERGPDMVDRLWLCATGVWKQGAFEALSFVAPTHLDRLKLADLIASLKN